MKRSFKIILGVLFLPTCFVQSVVFYQSLKKLKQFEGDEVYFLYGVFIYFLIHTLLTKPVFLYTWAHELVHAFAAMVFGGKVTSVKVSKKGVRRKRQNRMLSSTLRLILLRSMHSPFVSLRSLWCVFLRSKRFGISFF